jgi:hypothetical protein
MKAEDLKGHLLARGHNLREEHDRILANALLAEERGRLYRAELAANEGAQTEINQTLALLERPTP